MTSKEDSLLHSWQLITRVLERGLAPLVDLALRVLLFRLFFGAGWDQLSHWPETVARFRDVYQVPFLPYELAASLAVGGQLLGSVLVLIGLGARLGALLLLEVVIVIQFWLGLINPDYNRLEHGLWMVLLLLIVVRGPGKLSFDHRLRRLIEH